MPLIVGAWLVDVTAIEKVGSDADDVPSLTVILIFEYVPTCAVVGIPVRLPVELLKLAHDGLLVIEKLSVLPSASVAVG